MNIKDLHRGNELIHKIESLEQIIKQAQSFLEPDKEEDAEIYALVRSGRQWGYTPAVSIETVQSITLKDIKNKQAKLKELQDEFNKL